MSHHAENINGEMEIIERNQTDLELKSTIIEMKTSLGRLNSRVKQAKGRIGELEGRLMRLPSLSNGYKKKEKKNEQSLRNHQIYQHACNGSPRRTVRERRQREYMKN